MFKFRTFYWMVILGVGVISLDARVISYMSREQAVHWALPDADEIKEEKFKFNQDHKEVVENTLGWKLKKDEFIFYRGRVNGKTSGFAFLDEEIGKYQPITFVIALDPEGNVRDVDVVVYRESIGHEIKGRKFLDQFRGKNLRSPLKIAVDVDGITGATLSTRAAARSVRKALALFHICYGEGPR